jgi:hypothetical protein
MYMGDIVYLIVDTYLMFCIGRNQAEELVSHKYLRLVPGMVYFKKLSSFTLVGYDLTTYKIQSPQ